VQVDHLLPQLPLGRLKKREQAGGEEGVVFVPFGFVAKRPAGLFAQDLRNAGFKSGFGCLLVHNVRNSSFAQQDVANFGMTIATRVAAEGRYFDLFHLRAGKQFGCG
jgi:hypothetical protein